MKRTSRPPPRRSGVVARRLVAASSPVAAQQPAPEGPGPSATASTLVSAIVTLVIAGGSLAVAPDYTERTTDRIRGAPGRTLVYGVGVGITGAVVALLLALTIIGLVAAIPSTFALAVVGYSASSRRAGP